MVFVSYVEVLEVAGAEGGISESTDTPQTTDSHTYFCQARHNSFPSVASWERLCLLSLISFYTVNHKKRDILLLNYAKTTTVIIIINIKY